MLPRYDTSGLICGIYPTSSHQVASHICQTADTDILVIEDMALLKQAMGGKATIKEALPSVKTVVMIEATEEDMGINALIAAYGTPFSATLRSLFN